MHTGSTFRGVALYSIRLDETSEEALASAARARKVTRATIVREAIAEYGRATGREVTPFDRLSSLIGVIEDGPIDLSERSGEKFADLLSTPRPAVRKRTAPKKASPARRRAR